MVHIPKIVQAANALGRLENILFNISACANLVWHRHFSAVTPAGVNSIYSDALTNFRLLIFSANANYRALYVRCCCDFLKRSMITMIFLCIEIVCTVFVCEFV